MEPAAGDRRDCGGTFACAGGLGFSSGGQCVIEKRRRTGDLAVLPRTGAERRVVFDPASDGAGDHVADPGAVAAGSGRGQLRPIIRFARHSGRDGSGQRSCLFVCGKAARSAVAGIEDFAVAGAFPSLAGGKK